MSVRGGASAVQMAGRFWLPSTVALPSSPALAECLDACPEMGADAVPHVACGEVVNILSGAPGGPDGQGLVYAVACGQPPVQGAVPGPREGWLRIEAVGCCNLRRRDRCPRP